MPSKTQLLEIVKANVKTYKDFPKPGIVFRDIFGVLRSVQGAKALMSLMRDHILSIGEPLDAIVGLESRGFLFGPQLALELSIPFVPIRKKGKLPGEVFSCEYSLEYGNDVVEVQKDSLKAGSSIVIVDDLLATGGSLKGACELMEAVGVKVVQCFIVMELMDLKGREKLAVPVHSLLQY